MSYLFIPSYTFFCLLHVYLAAFRSIFLQLSRHNLVVNMQYFALALQIETKCIRFSSM